MNEPTTHKCYCDECDTIYISKEVGDFWTSQIDEEIPIFCPYCGETLNVDDQLDTEDE